MASKSKKERSKLSTAFILVSRRPRPEGRGGMETLDILHSYYYYMNYATHSCYPNPMFC